MAGRCPRRPSVQTDDTRPIYVCSARRILALCDEIVDVRIPRHLGTVVCQRDTSSKCKLPNPQVCKRRLGSVEGNCPVGMNRMTSHVMRGPRFVTSRAGPSANFGYFSILSTPLLNTFHPKTSSRGIVLRCALITETRASCPTVELVSSNYPSSMILLCKGTLLKSDEQ